MSVGITGVTDPDGNRYFDLAGSYGVNLLGHDFYKGCMARGLERVRELGVVLGPYHPVMVDIVRRLRAISGLDEVSFHMSGTEAVMQAVRLARYHTRRTHLVRFCGAYHGWWGDVQPGVGNPINAHETYTLKDMDADTNYTVGDVWSVYATGAWPNWTVAPILVTSSGMTNCSSGMITFLL